MAIPKTRYAKSGDINIAYQVIGDGPTDVLFVPGFVSHLDLAWEDPLYAEWMTRLSGFCRLILIDKRGTGLSDREVGESTLEERMDDLRAVFDAVGSKQCTVFGLSEGGALSMLFAAYVVAQASPPTPFVVLGAVAVVLDLVLVWLVLQRDCGEWVRAAELAEEHEQTA